MNSQHNINLVTAQRQVSQILPATNRLLEQLPPKLHSELLAACELVELQAGQVLCDAHDSLTHGYFPLTAFISMLAEMSDHPGMETGVIGNEGMVGATLVLGIKAAPQQAVVQGAGTALRISAQHLQAMLRSNPGLVMLLNRYLYVLFMQLSQTAACINYHPVETRLTRWLLMTHDRTYVGHLHITHQVLADLLGVQRSAVTIAAGVLQDKGLISYSRGDITILDRKGLERNCCECYSTITRIHQRFEAGK